MDMNSEFMSQKLADDEDTGSDPGRRSSCAQGRSPKWTPELEFTHDPLFIIEGNSKVTRTVSMWSVTADLPPRRRSTQSPPGGLLPGKNGASIRAQPSPCRCQRSCVERLPCGGGPSRCRAVAVP